MNDKHKTDRGPMPKDIQTNTQITVDDLKESPDQDKQPDSVDEQQVEQDVVLINPDPGSMESRG